MTRRIVALALAAMTFTGCEISQLLDTSGPDDTVARLGPDGGEGSGSSVLGEKFGYTEVNPPGLETWTVAQAHRTEEGIWALYEDPNSEAQTVAFLDFVTREWTDWGAIGDIRDIDGDGLVLAEVDGEYRLQWVQGVEVDISVLEGSSLGDVAIERGIGTHQAQTTLFWNNFAAWREEGLCCPNQWERLVNDDYETYAFVDEVWGGYPGTGGAWAAAGSDLWWVGFEGWTRVEGMSGHWAQMAIDRVGHHAYATSDCTLYGISSDMRSATVLNADMSAGVASGLGAALCGSTARMPVDTDGTYIYAPFGKVFTTDGTLVSSWLGTPEMDPNDLEQYGRDMVAFTQAYSPGYIFVDPTAFGDIYVWSLPVADAFGERQPGGWLHIPDANTGSWEDPHPSVQN